MSNLSGVFVSVWVAHVICLEMFKEVKKLLFIKFPSRSQVMLIKINKTHRKSKDYNVPSVSEMLRLKSRYLKNDTLPY